ncbi:MAG: peptidylprolyl isomerase [Acidobacteriaceae bacterium]|nr:peptidylprolyl isomerase [Acidobacteriaceae bacterium]
MFDLFRSREKSVRILLGVLLGLVAISMLFYLIPGGTSGGGFSNQNVVATVGDDKITSVDIQRAIQAVTRGQQNLPKGVLAMYVPSLVNQMIEAKAMAYKAHEMGLRISDDELGDAIEGELTAAMGGKFDKNTYQMVLAQQGMTVSDFENSRRETMLATRLENLESQSLVITDQEARAEYQRKNLKIGLNSIKFEAKDFASKVNKDPAALKAYFDKNRATFQIPEKRTLNLIVGANADFVQNAKVTDAQLQREYQENIDAYRIPERVLVRHILIKTQGLPKDQAPKLKAKAEDILKQLQNGGNFAELAKQNSDDPGSKPKGGELGWIVRGQTVPNFENTAFSLKPGQLSGVIETEYGYHIIQVEDKQAAHTQTFEEVKPTLIAQLRSEVGAEDLKKAIDAARAETIRNPGQAEAIAKKYNLRFFKVDNFARTGSLPEVNTPPELVNAIFGNAKNGTTDVVDVQNQGKQAFAVITNIVPARNAEYAEVENDVLQRYTAAESSRLAQQAAQDAANRARKGESLEAIAKQYGIEVKTSAPFTIDGAAEGIGSASLVSAAFKDNVGDVIGPVSAQSGEFVCKISEKVPADLNQFGKSKDTIVQELTQQRQGVEQPLFRKSIVDELKRRHKIKINEAALERIIGSYQS